VGKAAIKVRLGCEGKDEQIKPHKDKGMGKDENQRQPSP
jgi:hypothetical protein